MGTTKFFGKGESVVSFIILLIIAGIMGLLMVGDVNRMHEATTNYEYYKNFVYLIDNIARTYFFITYLVMVYLTYINKQYSKWCVRLFYLIGVSVLLYYAFAGFFISHIIDLIETDYVHKLHSIAHTLYTGPIFWVIIGYFFIPKILKDAQKLKEEQDLTI